MSVGTTSPLKSAAEQLEVVAHAERHGQAGLHAPVVLDEPGVEVDRSVQFGVAGAHLIAHGVGARVTWYRQPVGGEQEVAVEDRVDGVAAPRPVALGAPLEVVGAEARRLLVEVHGRRDDDVRLVAVLRVVVGLAVLEAREFDARAERPRGQTVLDVGAVRDAQLVREVVADDAREPDRREHVVGALVVAAVARHIGADVEVVGVLLAQQRDERQELPGLERRGELVEQVVGARDARHLGARVGQDRQQERRHVHGGDFVGGLAFVGAEPVDPVLA